MNKWLYWLLPAGWMAVIFYSSSQPYQEQDIKPFLANIDLSFLGPLLSWIRFDYHHSEVSVAAQGINGVIEFFIRKGAHVTVFLILMLLFYTALVNTWSKTKQILKVTALTLTVTYAALDEIHQSLTPNRTPYFGDVVLDTAGALLGLLLLVILEKIKFSQK